MSKKVKEDVIEKLVSLSGPYFIENPFDGTCNIGLSDEVSEEIVLKCQNNLKDLARVCNETQQNMQDGILKQRVKDLAVQAEMLDEKEMVYAEVHFRNTETDIYKGHEKAERFNALAETICNEKDTIADMQNGTEYNFYGGVSGYNGDAYIKGFFNETGLKELRKVTDEICAAGYRLEEFKEVSLEKEKHEVQKGSLKWTSRKTDNKEQENTL